MEIVWEDSRIAAPGHLVRWNNKGVGYSAFREFALWWTRGTVRKPVPRPPARRLHSHLSRNYGLEWRVKSRIIEKEGLLPS